MATGATTGGDEARGRGLLRHRLLLGFHVGDHLLEHGDDFLVHLDDLLGGFGQLGIASSSWPCHAVQPASSRPSSSPRWPSSCLRRFACGSWRWPAAPWLPPCCPCPFPAVRRELRASPPPRSRPPTTWPGWAPCRKSFGRRCPLRPWWPWCGRPSRDRPWRGQAPAPLPLHFPRTRQPEFPCTERSSSSVLLQTRKPG